MSKDIPAFPPTIDVYREQLVGAGMSLRDYFAAAALAGIWGNMEYLRNVKEMFGDGGVNFTAVSAFEIADSMIAARGGKQTETTEDSDVRS